MNPLGTILVWSAIQATLLCIGTAAVYYVARRRHPGAGAITASAGLLLCGALTLAELVAASFPADGLRAIHSNESRHAV
jgi:hypothetical protein